MLKYNLFICILLIGLAACKKNSEEPIASSPLQTQAMKLLKEQMAPADFATLNWSQAAIKKCQGKEFLLIVPGKDDPARSLYYSNATGTAVYNWAKMELRAKDGKNISGTLTTTDIHNQLLNKIEFVNNKMVSQARSRILQRNNGIGVKQKQASDDEELPPVTVVTYIYQTAYDYFSLYWIFNSMYEYLPLFEGGYEPAQIIDVNSNSFLIGTSYTCKPDKDILSNGSAQITATYPGAFLFSKLKLIFTFNPATNELNTTSISSYPFDGIFLGTWVGPTVSRITTNPSFIEFDYSYINTYMIGLFPAIKEYKMRVKYFVSSNDLTWTWQ